MKKSFEKPRLSLPVTAAVSCVLLYVGFAAVFALVFCLFDINRGYIPLFSTLALALSCFVTSFFTARRAGDKGYLIGGIIGFAAFAAVTAVSVFASAGRFTLNTLFHLLLTVLSSAVGGILGVNSKGRKII